MSRTVYRKLATFALTALLGAGTALAVDATTTATSGADSSSVIARPKPHAP